jgi:hypothetical protein
MFDGTTAFISGDLIYFSKDFSTEDLQHEYVHTQQLPFFFGGGKILGRAIAEAFTEQQIDNPTTYPRARKVLSEIVKHIPKFTEKLFAYGKLRQTPALDEVVITLLQYFGPRLTLDILAMSPTGDFETERNEYFHGNKFLKDPYYLSAEIKNFPKKANTDKTEVGRKVLELLDIEISKNVLPLSEEMKLTADRAVMAGTFELATYYFTNLLQLWRSNRDLLPKEVTRVIKVISIRFPEKYQETGDLISQTLVAGTHNNNYFLQAFIEEVNFGTSVPQPEGASKNSQKFLNSLKESLLKKVGIEAKNFSAKH